MPRQTNPQMPLRQIEMNDFPGLMLNTDADDIPPGAAREQVNVASSILGDLVVRSGYRQVTFED